jgi:hypothetical protein
VSISQLIVSSEISGVADNRAGYIFVPVPVVTIIERHYNINRDNPKKKSPK